ncbi:pentapeptide repeat-containing protein [Mucilaginibacter terrenus]|uniref:Pentapeptide repeat-containing protein n=1 Tax=Mucilaginibacter terrenus TaxID=2482727 RepID=A0A3E2NVF2_9SPHI|nr:pentapeptide repeat-containing protein [Mucilaginibacter terrenus]RFZ84985.1 pentapeptide repeat-containing protein [Mucilaginibacter terrenus]
METLEIKQAEKKISATEVNLAGSSFTMACLNNARFEDVALVGVKITNANLSDLEIDGAQLGGAFIHNIGMPPEGHPFFDPNAKQRPLKFENCDLNNSTFTSCDLSGVSISCCNITGMQINGILVEELLKAYENRG